ncbi:putative chitinase 10 [Dermacentor variabilis]|uniref:putative chitinase 10 n=1 Tax=Dermacentor variabilis TaxID=34621 RepID=UPI003F5C2F98
MGAGYAEVEPGVEAHSLEEPRVGAVGTDVLLSVACLLSVLVGLLALAVALEALLLRVLNLDASASAAQPTTRPPPPPARQPRLQRHQQQMHHEEKSSGGEERTVLSSLPNSAYQSSRKMFCVFNGSPRNGSRLRRGYGLDFFPHQLCTDAVLCCAGLELTTLELDVDSAQALRFAALRLTHAQLRLWLCVGGDETRSKGFGRAAEDAEARRRLVSGAIGWLQESGFQGLLLHWALPGPQRPQQLVRILAPLKVALDLTDQSLGAVIPLDDEQRARFDAPAVGDLLGHHAVLVLPDGSAAWQYNRTFLPYSQQVVEQYARAADELSHEACYLVTLSGTSLVLEDRNMWEVGDPARGPGTLGNGSQPGLAALDEVCMLQWVGSKVKRYGTYSRLGTQWAGYLTAGTLRELLADLANATSSRGAAACLGVADPEWDDFAARCRPGLRFPLTRVVAAAALGIKALAEDQPVSAPTSPASSSTTTTVPSDDALIGT